MTEDWKAKLGAAFNMEASEESTEAATPAQEQQSAVEQQGGQMVNVLLDKKGRNGKKATLIVDLKCDEATLKELAATLKKHCGVGGSARGGEILIQGDFRTQVVEQLKQMGFKARTI